MRWTLELQYLEKQKMFRNLPNMKQHPIEIKFNRNGPYILENVV